MARGRLDIRIGANAQGFYKTLRSVKSAAFSLVKYGGMAAGAAGSMWAVAIAKTAAYGDAIAKTAKRMGFGVVGLQELKYAAELSGSSMEDLEKASKRLSLSIKQGQDGLATSKRAFGQLKLSIEALAGMTPEQQLDAVLVALSGIESASQRAALAQEVLGRAGTKMLPMLTKGAEGLRGMKSEADRLGILLTPQQVEAAEEFQDAMLRVKSAMAGIARSAVANDIQPLTDAMNEFVESGNVAVIEESLKRISAAFAGGAVGIAEWAQQKDNLEALRESADGLAVAIEKTVGGVIQLLDLYTQAQRWIKEKAEPSQERAVAEQRSVVEAGTTGTDVMAARELRARGVDISRTDPAFWRMLEETKSQFGDMQSRRTIAMQTGRARLADIGAIHGLIPAPDARVASGIAETNRILSERMPAGATAE